MCCWPINSFELGKADCVLFGLDMTPVADLAAKLRRAYTSVPSERNPMLNFDERDLLRWAREAEALAQTLTGQERDRVETHLRTALAAGTPARKTLATAHLRAIRP
jgi:arsenite methyltransferase